jgi:hypothetical protein
MAPKRTSLPVCSFCWPGLDSISSPPSVDLTPSLVPSLSHKKFLILSMSFWNVGIRLQGYMVSQSRRTKSDQIVILVFSKKQIQVSSQDNLKFLLLYSCNIMHCAFVLWNITRHYFMQINNHFVLCNLKLKSFLPNLLGKDSPLKEKCI